MEHQELSQEHKRVLIDRAAYWHEVGEYAVEQRRACLEELGMVQVVKDAVKLVLIRGGSSENN